MVGAQGEAAGGLGFKLAEGLKATVGTQLQGGDLEALAAKLLPALLAALGQVQQVAPQVTVTTSEVKKEEQGLQSQTTEGAKSSQGKGSGSKVPNQTQHKGSDRPRDASRSPRRGPPEVEGADQTTQAQ